MKNLIKNSLSICLMFFIASVFAFIISPTAYAQKAELVVQTGHRWYVVSVVFSPNGKILASGGGWDGNIKLWDVSKREEVASLITVAQTDYVIATHDNYYTASKGALKGVAFRVGNRAFPFEQFDLKLNRPDIVLKRIGYAPQELIASYYKAYQKRLKKMNFTEEMLGDDFHLPEIAITSQNLPLSTKEKMLRFGIKATDSKYLLDRFNVYVNDVLIYGINGINLRDKKVATLSQDISLELCNGRNKIQVSALNNKGAESLKETFEVIYNGPETLPDLYVVVIGVFDYLNDKYDLTYAAKDANDLITLLQGKKERFGKINVLRTLDKDATKENILKAKAFFMKSKVDNQVILFVAGHGVLDDKLDYYFATTDFDLYNPAVRDLPYEEIENLLDGIPARKKLVLIDTCHSGEVDREETEVIKNKLASNIVVARAFRGIKIEFAKKRKNSLGLQNSFELLRELFADLRRGSGAMVISSASGMELAIESDKWKNGVFTYAVLEGLQTNNADLDKNDVILDFRA